MTTKKPKPDRFGEALEAAIATGRRLMRGARDRVDTCDTSHGLLAGAIEHWLAAHQVCDHAGCETGTPEKRLTVLLQLVERFARASHDLHAGHDTADVDAPETVQ